MKLLQKIPSGITLQKERYEWQITAHNKSSKGSMWKYKVIVVIKLLFGLALFGLEWLMLGKLMDLLAQRFEWGHLLYYAIFFSQGIVFLFFCKELLNDIKKDLERQVKVFYLALKNEGFELSIQVKSPKQGRTKWYDRATIKEVFYNRGPQQKAAGLKTGLWQVPQEIFIRPKAKGAVPEAWGQFLRADQTEFLSLLLRTLYPQKKVDQQIPKAPPPPIEEDDFEDLSRHLIDD